MLEDFLRRQGIDMLFLQEVAHSTIDTLCSYKTCTNVWTAGRGSAMVTRNEITFTNITRLPSGRRITSEYRGIWLVNVYAPSGTAKRQERELFYNNELPYLLRASPSNMIVGEDFNCVLNQTDSTGHFNLSKALDGIVRGFELQDMWRADPLRTVFSHYSPMGTSRIDRIYTTKELSEKKIGVETVAVAFTDHLSVVMRLSVDVPIVRGCKGFWKMNTSILSEEAFKERLRQTWAAWGQQRRFYPYWPMCCGGYTKHGFVFSVFRKVPNVGGTS